MISSLPPLLLLLTASAVHAHVAMVYPVPRTDNDYLYTFDAGVCDRDSTCAGFCGDVYNTNINPVTTLQVGVPITLRWKTKVAHAPLQYRLSLNPTASDNHFDVSENILTTISNADAADPSNAGRQTGSFSTIVTIPESAMETCSGGEPCVLQLWDLYYFVSCANVLLTKGEVDQEEVPATPAPDTVTLPPLPEKSENTILFQGASFEDYRVTMGMEEPQLDPILYLERCRDYTFIINARGHPFVLKNQPGLGMDNVLVIDGGQDYTTSETYPTEGTERGSFTFRAGPDAPTTGIFYQCTLHIGMVSEIVLVDNGKCDVSNENEGAGDNVDGNEGVVGEGSDEKAKGILSSSPSIASSTGADNNTDGNAGDAGEGSDDEAEGISSSSPSIPNSTATTICGLILIGVTAMLR